MKIPNIKAHLEALSEIIITKILEDDPIEVASEHFDIWQDWREEVYGNLPEQKSEQMQMYLADRRWKILTWIAYINLWNPKSWRFWGNED